MEAEDGTKLVEKEAVKERWTEYFEGLLNVEEDREAEIAAVGRENGGKVLRGCYMIFIIIIIIIIIVIIIIIIIKVVEGEKCTRFV